jgi:hypothetical protein
MKKLLFILPVLLLLTACGEMTSNTTPANPEGAVQKEGISNETASESDNAKTAQYPSSTKENNEDINNDQEIANVKSEKETLKTLDCNETCDRAEKDTDGVVSEKECLTICNTGVENCQSKLEKGEITGDILELCAVNELIKEVKVRYPDLESLF